MINLCVFDGNFISVIVQNCFSLPTPMSNLFQPNVGSKHLIDFVHVSQLDEGEAELDGDGVRGVEDRPATVVIVVQQTTQQAMLVWQRLVVMVTIRTVVPF